MMVGRTATAGRWWEGPHRPDDGGKDRNGQRMVGRTATAR